MKKLLLGIFWLFFWLSSFCSAELFNFSVSVAGSLSYNSYYDNYFTLIPDEWVNFSITWFLLFWCYKFSPIDYVDFVLSWFNDNNFSSSSFIFDNYYSGYLVSFDPIIVNSNNPLIVPYHFYSWCSSVYAPRLNRDYFPFNINYWNNWYFTSQSPVYWVYITTTGLSSSSDITVFYDFWHSSTTIACNWDNSIFINGMSSYSWLTFTPFFNINYIDEDNQNIIESYNKDILYLVGWKYHKTYTWDNLWVLNLVWWNSNSWWFNIISSWFNISWDIVSDNLSWNIFKNFIDTWFTVLFSNIPSYIQYVILILILIFILRIFTKKRRKF